MAIVYVPNKSATFSDGIVDMIDDTVSEFQDQIDTLKKDLEYEQRKNHAARRIVRRRHNETQHRRSLWSRYR